MWAITVLELSWSFRKLRRGVGFGGGGEERPARDFTRCEASFVVSPISCFCAVQYYPVSSRASKSGPGVVGWMGLWGSGNGRGGGQGSLLCRQSFAVPFCVRFGTARFVFSSVVWVVTVGASVRTS